MRIQFVIIRHQLTEKEKPVDTTIMIFKQVVKPEFDRFRLNKTKQYNS